ncbi:MAG: hypothetical protein ACREX0_15485 [Noviherbaspirillum sp.]
MRSIGGHKTTVLPRSIGQNQHIGIEGDEPLNRIEIFCIQDEAISADDTFMKGTKRKSGWQDAARLPRHGWFVLMFPMSNRVHSTPMVTDKSDEIRWEKCNGIGRNIFLWKPIKIADDSLQQQEFIYRI